MALQKFRGKYWATVFVEVEFEAIDEIDADEMMDGYPGNDGDIRFKEINGVEERSDYEVKPLADVEDDGNSTEPEMVLPVETALATETQAPTEAAEDDGTRECGCCGEQTGDWIEVSMPFCDVLCDVCADV